MTTFPGALYRGHTADVLPVTITAEGDNVTIAGDGLWAALPRSTVTVDDPIPGVPRLLTLPGGATIETDANAEVTTLWPTRRFAARTGLALESRWSTTAGAVGGIALTVWFAIAVVLPMAAKPIADRISPEFEALMGRQALTALDQPFTQPTQLSEEQQQEIRDEFEKFIAGEPGASDYDLEFRRLGDANAFALPGRIIVVSDEMVEYVRDDDELLAVIAHELGHAHNRHAVRMILQQSGIFILVTALAGDAVGFTILAAALPAQLLESHYSRDFEREADDYAVEYLRHHGRSPQAFAAALKHFAENPKLAKDDGLLGRYLSSHPGLQERIARVEREK